MDCQAITTKLRKTLFLIGILLLTAAMPAKLWAQPNWALGTPALSIAPTSNDISADYSLDEAGTVYIIVINFNYSGSPTSQDIKDAAIAGPSGGRVATAVLNFASGDVGNILTHEFLYLQYNRYHAVYLVAEDDDSGTLQANPTRIDITTNSCPNITITRNVIPTAECLDDPVTVYFSAALPFIGESGITIGTVWDVDWGDGTNSTFTSQFDDDLPDSSDVLQHTYDALDTDCNYVVEFTILNECGESDNGRKVIVVHGRDDQIDGVLELTDTLGNDIVEICEGTEATVIIEDASTWNCQNPVLPGSLPTQPNDDPRWIQFDYGTYNDITGTVVIDGLGNAPQTGPVDYPISSVGHRSAGITIPATAVAGERFEVTMNNWNKCNTYPGNSPITTTIDIIIISTPEASMSADQEICESEIPGTSITMTATGGGGSGDFKWRVEGPGGTDNYNNEPSPFTLDVSADLSTGVNTFYLTRVQASAGNGCVLTGDPIDSVNITVTPNVNPGSINGDQNICENGDPGLLGEVSGPSGGDGPGTYIYQWLSSTTSGGPYSAIGGATNPTYDPPAGITNTTYYVREVTSGQCTEISNEVAVIVTPALDPGTINGDQNVCEGGDPSVLGEATAPSGGDGSYTYQWKSSLASGGPYANIGGATNATYNPPAGITNTTYYVREVTSATCIEKTNEVAVTVTPTLNPGSINGDQTICEGGDPSSLNQVTAPGGGEGAGTYSFQWQSGTTSGGPYANIGGATGASYNPPAGLTQTTYYVRQVTSGACTEISNEITVTVTPTLNPGTVASDQLICENGDPDPFTVSVAASGGNGAGTYTYQWKSAAASGGPYTDIIGATSATYDPPGPISAETFYIREVSSGACTELGNELTISITPTLNPGSINGDQTLCVGGDPTLLGEASGPSGGDGAGTYSYQWKSSGSSGGPYTNIAGATNPTYDPPSGIASTTYFVREISSGACTEISNEVEVIVTTMDPGTIGSDQSICNGDTPAQLTESTGASGGTGSFSYQWQSSGSSGGPYADIGGATGINYQPPAIGSTTYYVRKVTSGGCVEITNEVEIIVNPAGPGPAGAITGDNLVCEGQYNVPYNIAAVPNATDYVWSVDPGATITSGQGTTDITLQFDNPAPASVTLQVFPQNGCGAGGSSSLVININNSPTANDQTPDACSDADLGSTATVDLTSNNNAIDGGAGHTITWYENADLSGSIGTPGAYSVTDATPVYALVDDGVCEDTATVTYTVYQTPDLTITNNATEICSGSDSDIDLSSTLAGTTFSWTVVTGAANGASAGSGTSIQQTLNNGGTAPVTVTYEVTPTGPAPLNCAGTPQQVDVIVNPIPDLTITNNLTDICSGSDSDIDLSSSVTGTTFSWTVVTGAANGASAGTGTSIQQTLTNSGNSAVTVTYRVTATGPAPTNCASPTQDVDVIVHPNPGVTATNNAPEICENDFTDIDLSSNVVGTTFSWIVTAGGTSGATGGSGNTISQQLSNPGTSPLTVTYEITPTGPAPTNCVGSSTTVDVTVNPDPDVIATNNNPQICSGGSSDIDLTGNVAGTTFSWTVIAGGGTGASAGSGTQINQVLTNGTNAPITVTYRVTPTGPAPTNCTGNFVDVNVIVNPIPDVIATNNNGRFCSGGDTDIDLASSVGSVNFSWSVIAGGGTGATGGTGNKIAQTLTNSTNAPVTVTYRITPTGPAPTNCVGSSVDVDVIVDPIPAVTIIDNADPICDNSSTNISLSSAVAGTSFDWIVTAGGATGATGGSGNSIAQTLTNGTNAPITVTYEVTPTGPAPTNCVGTAVSENVVVHPIPDVSATNNAPDICNGDATDIVLSSSVAGVTFDWIVTAGGGTGATAGSGNSINQNLTNAGTTPITVTYQITPTGPNPPACVGSSIDVDVIVNPTPDVIPTNNAPEICSGNATDITMASSVAGTSYSWTVIAGGGTGATNGSGNNITQTLTNLGTSPVTVTYRITPTGPAPSSCVGPFQDVDVIVNPAPTAVITNDAPAICTGGSTDITVSSSTAGTTFDYTVIAGGGTGATGGSGLNIGDKITQTLTNLGTTPVTVTYRITPTGPAPTSCSGPSVDVDVVVDPEPDVVATNNAPQICNGDDTDIDLNSNVANTTFSYSVVAGAGTGATGGTANIGDKIQQTLTNLGTTPVTVTYRITPTGPAPTNCTGPFLDVDVIVNPTPDVIPTNNAPQICSGENTDIDLGSNVAGTSFDWTVIAGASTGASDGSGVIGDKIDQTLTNSTQTPVTVTYRITPTGPAPTSCPGPFVDVDVIVNPLPNTTAITGPTEACVNTTDMVYQVTLTTGSTYDWTVPAALGTVTFGGDGLNSNAVIITAAGAPTTDSISVVETNSYTCVGDTRKIGVTLYPYPTQVTVTGPDEVCAEETGVTFSVPYNAGSTYNWSLPLGAAITSTPADSNEIVVSFDQFGGDVDVIETGAAGCVTDHIARNVTVNPLPVPGLTADDASVCDGTTITFTATPAGAANYEFFVDGSSVQSGPSDTYADNSFTDGQQVTVVVTDANGCEGTSPVVTVTIFPNPTVTIAADDTEICDGQNVTVTATSATASNYEFFVNGGSVQDGPSNFYSTTTLADGDNVTCEVTTAQGCTALSNVVNFIVHPVPTAVLSGDASICPGDSTDLSVNITDGTAPYNVTIDQSVGTITGYNSTDPIYVSPAVTTTYQLLQVVDANNCQAPPANLSGTPTVTLLEDIGIDAEPADATRCPGDNVSFTVTASGTGPITYQWEKDGTPLINGGDISGADAATLNIVNLDASDAGDYHVEVSGACAPANSDTVTLTMNEDISVVTQPVGNTLCPGETFKIFVEVTGTNPTYRWRRNGVNLFDGGDISGADTDTLTITNVSAADAGNYDVVVSGTCAPATSNVATLVVNVDPEITTQPVSTTVCEGDPATFSVNAGATTAPTFRWEVSTDGGSTWNNVADDAEHDNPDMETLTLVNVPSSFDGDRYRAVVSGACTPDAVSDPVTLTVNEKPEIITQPANQTECEDGAVTFSANAGVTTAPVYQWEFSTDGGTTWNNVPGGLPYSGENSANLNISPVTSGLHNNQYRVNVSGTCAPDVTSNPATLTVDEKPEILDHPDNVVECEGQPVTFTVDPGVTTAPTYQWEVDSAGVFVALTDGGEFSGSTSQTLTVDPISSRMHTWRFRVILSGTCSPARTSTAANLSVQENPEITVQPTNKTICEDGGTTFSVVPGVTTNPTYQWEKSTDGGTTWNNVVDDAEHDNPNLATLTLMNVPSTFNGDLYRVVVNGTCGIPVTSNPVTLTVNEKPEVTLDPVSQNICEDSDVTFTVDAGVTTNPTYQWQEDSGSGFTDLTDDATYSGVLTNSLTINPVTSAMNTRKYRVIVSGTCTPEATSGQATLTVWEKPEIQVQPADVTECEDGSVQYTINPGVTTNPSYQWEVSTDGGSTWNNASGAPYSGETTATLTVNPVISTMEGNQYRVVLSGNCAPDSTSEAASLDILEKPEVVADPANVTACESDTVSFTVDPGLTDNPVYQWQLSTDGGATFSNLFESAIYEDVAGQTLTVNGINSSMHNHQFRAQISGACAPPVNSLAATLTVDEKPEIITQPTDKTICEGDNTSFTVNSGVTTAPVYQWEISTDGGTTWNNVSNDAVHGDPNLATLDLTAAPSSFDGNQYRVVISGDCAPSVTSNVVTLTVYERPEILADPVSVTECENSPVSFTVDPGVTTGASFQWEISTDGGTTWSNVSGGSYSGINAATLQINPIISSMNGNQYRVIVSGACTPGQTSNPATLTVDERPEILTQPVSQVICENDNVSFFIDEGVTTSPNFLWEVSTDNGITWTALGDTGVYSGTATNTLQITASQSYLDQYRYRVTVFGDCTPEVTSSQALLTVNERPEIITPPAGVTECEDQTISFTVDAGVTTQPTYQWQIDEGSGFVNLADTGRYNGSTSPTLTVFNLAEYQDGNRYQVIVDGYCNDPVTSAVADLDVLFKPEITVNTVNDTVCAGELAEFSVTARGDNLTYTWFGKSPTGVFNPLSTGGAFTVNDDQLTISPADSAFNGWTFYVNIQGDCTPQVNANIAKLVVNRPPTIWDEPDNFALCESSGNADFDVVATGTDLTYQWQQSVDGGSTWTNLSDGGRFAGTQTSSFTVISPDTTFDGRMYRARINSPWCLPGQTTAEVTLTVYGNPRITGVNYPEQVIVCEDGTIAPLTVNTTGYDLTYQWEVNEGLGFNTVSGGEYTGGTTSSLTISDVPLDFHNNTYRLRIDNLCAGPVYSDEVDLFVRGKLDRQDSTRLAEICEFGTTTSRYIVTAPNNSDPVGYQWQVSTDGGSTWNNVSNGGPISGANQNQINFINTPDSYDGNLYRLRMTGMCDVQYSEPDELIVNSAPDVNPQTSIGTNTICGKTNVELLGNVSGGSGTYTRYTWSGAVQWLDATDQEDVTFNSIQPGVYSYTFFAEDSKGCKGSDTITLTVQLPKAQINYTPDTIQCSPAVITFEAVDAVGTVTWDFGDGSPISNDNPATHTYENLTSVTQPYTIELSVNDGKCVNTSSAQIFVYPAVDARMFTPDTVGCNPLSAVLTASPGAERYEWNYGDGNSDLSYVNFVQHQYSNFTDENVTYEAVLKTYSAFGCVAYDTLPITVVPAPQAAFLADPSQMTVPQTTVNFINQTSPGNWIYEWNFGDQDFTTSTEENPTFDYGTDGTYFPKLTVSDPSGLCTDTRTTKIVILPTRPIADFAVPDGGCTPHFVTFENNSQFGKRYEWVIEEPSGASQTLYEENPSFVFTNEGLWKITLRAIGVQDTIVDVVTRQIEIFQSPQPFLNAAPTLVFVNDVPVKCFNLSTDTIQPTYIWDFGDGTTSNEFEPAHVYTEPGIYEIQLVAINNFGSVQCADTNTFREITVEPAGTLTFPNVFRPNPDGPTGGRYTPGSDNNTVFYPVLIDQVIEYELTIYNRWGELLFISNDVNVGWDGYVDGKQAEQGVYIWKVKGKYANGKSFVDAGDITLLR